MVTKQYIAAAIIEQNGKILIAQRTKRDSFFGTWEFPGGKVEAGESLQDCLKRELFEELNIHIDSGEYFSTSSFYQNKTSFEMCVFKVSSFSGEIKLNEHSAMAWVTPEELSNYSFPEPDLPIVALLQQKNGTVKPKSYWHFLKKQLYPFVAMSVSYIALSYLASRFFSVEPKNYATESVAAYAVIFIVLGAYIQYRMYKMND